jgi:hypothetical protein
MTEWITDRLPTERDADAQGDVRIPSLPDRKPCDNTDTWQHWSLVVPGQSWWSHFAPEPAPEPAPVAGRKVVQIDVMQPENDYHGQKAFALCDDGTMWTSSISNTMCAPWQQLPPIPQPEPQT